MFPLASTYVAFASAIYMLRLFQMLDIISYLFKMSETRSCRRPPAVPPVLTISTTSIVEEGDGDVDVVVVASEYLLSEPT